MKIPVMLVSGGLLLIIVIPHAMAQRSNNFTSYTGDLTNTTAMIQWSTIYCHFDNQTHNQIANDLDPKHTAECNKTYDFAINILSNAINTEGKKVDKQFKHCKNTEGTIEGMRVCMGLN
jgi:hypothetical protein